LFGNTPSITGLLKHSAAIPKRKGLPGDKSEVQFMPDHFYQQPAKANEAGDLKHDELGNPKATIDCLFDGRFGMSVGSAAGW